MESKEALMWIALVLFWAFGLVQFALKNRWRKSSNDWRRLSGQQSAQMKDALNELSAANRTTAEALKTAKGWQDLYEAEKNERIKLN